MSITPFGSAPTAVAPIRAPIDGKRLLIVTYADLLRFLIHPTSSDITYAELDWLLNDRLERFQNPENPFLSSNDAHKAQVQKLSVRGLSLTAEEKDLVLKIGKTFEIDEIQVALLWKSYAVNFGLAPLARGKEPGSVADESDIIKNFILFYLEERLNVLRIVGALLRSSGDASDAMYDVAQGHLAKILHPLEEQLRKFLVGFDHSTRRTLPATARTPEYHYLTTPYARFFVQEQITLLEVVFLAFYTYTTPNARFISELLRILYQTHLGGWQKHTLPLLNDGAGAALLLSLRTIAVLLAVEVMALESLWQLDFSLPEQSGVGLMSSPEHLAAIHDILLTTPTDPIYSPIVLAWSLVLHCLTDAMVAAERIPPAWLELLRAIAPEAEKGPATLIRGKRPAFEEFAVVAFSDEMKLFETINDILSLPPFTLNTDAGSAILTPANSVGYRSVLKGLLVSVPTLVKLNFLSPFAQYVQTLSVLFGEGPQAEVAPLVREFWLMDAPDPERGSVLAVLGRRAPVSLSSLLKLLTALCGNGRGYDSVDDDAGTGASEVWRWFAEMQAFTCITKKEDIGVLWDATSKGWIAKKPMSFPGGGVMEKGSRGTVVDLGDGNGNGVILTFPIRWSGWRLLMDVLRAYARKGDSRAAEPKFDKKAPIISFALPYVGVDAGATEEETVGYALDLIAALLYADPSKAEAFAPFFTAASDPTDSTSLLAVLVRLLDVFLLRPSQRAQPTLRTITPIISILTSLLSSRSLSSSLWAHLRVSAVFAMDGTFARLVAHEQLIGIYTVSLQVVNFVSSLVKDAQRTQFSIAQTPAHQLRAEVLQQALGFVFREVWQESFGWKYSSIVERILLGRRMSDIWNAMLGDWAFAPTANAQPSPYRQVALGVLDAFLSKSSAITPLITILSSGPTTIIALSRAGKSVGRDMLCALIEAQLHIARIALSRKQSLGIAGLCMLENMMFSPATSLRQSTGVRSQLDMIQVLADYVIVPYPGSGVQLEAASLLAALCGYIAATGPSPPSLVGHLADAAQTVNTLVDNMLNNPLCPGPLRTAVWNFASMAVITHQALGGVFITGALPLGPALSDKAQGKRPEGSSQSSQDTAVKAAIDIVGRWEDLRYSEAGVLAAALGFLDVCWQHLDEHRAGLNFARDSGRLWKDLVSIASWDIGEEPALGVFQLQSTPLRKHRSSVHEAVNRYAYHLVIKAHAVHILALDMATSPVRQPGKSIGATSPPSSFKELQSILRQSSTLKTILMGAIKNSCSPSFMRDARTNTAQFPRFVIEMLQSPLPSMERESGDDYCYPLDLVALKLDGYQPGVEKHQSGMRSACALNLSWTLIDRQIALTRSWQSLLEAASTWLGAGDPALRVNLINAAVVIAEATAAERRASETMAAIHAERVAFLRAMIVAVGISPTGVPSSTTDIYGVLANVHKLFTHETFRPLESLSGRSVPQFHRPLLQVVQWCARMLGTRDADRSRDAQQRLTVTSGMLSALTFIIVALREVLDGSRADLESEPSDDLALLVEAFDGCTRLELHATPSVWLGICQEADLIRASLEFLSKTNIGGVSKESNQNLAHPLYASQILEFHMILTKVPEGAERLAQGGALAAYTNNCLTAVIEGGLLDVRDSAIVDRRSLAHEAWCMILSVTSALVRVLGSISDFVDVEIVSFVQLYGFELTTVLEWKTPEPLTLARVEELERVVGLFYALSESSAVDVSPSSRSFDILRVYNDKALGLIQQLNYALTHPNHLSSLLEPISAEERFYFEQDEIDIAVDSTAEVINPARRPALSSLMQRLYLITRDIILSITTLSRADVVIRTADPKDWPQLHNLRLPLNNTSVTLSQPATIGTFLELGGYAVDAFSHLVALPPTAASSKSGPVFTASAPPFDRATSLGAVRELQEVLLLYTTAQVARWMVSESAATAKELPEEESDDFGQHMRRGSVGAVGIADRRTMEVRGQLTKELYDLLVKAERVDGRRTGNLITLLRTYVEKRFTSPQSM